ncbi:MAG: helix-turn-helix domain-containing protein [Lachnospiraceae bacterium]
MAELGENLKNVREQKGYTQQTLADHLYVTRQAISRWEGGSRYPDLMTAKKMARFLEVSLDDLLTDDDMKLYAEKNAIIENPTAKRGQIILLSLAFMSLLFLSIIQLTSFCFKDGNVLVYNSETPKYFLLTILLGISIFSALFDRLNAKTTLMIYSGYFGISLLIGGINVFSVSGGFITLYFAGTMVLNLLCFILCIRFFAGKRITSPVPLYVTCAIYGTLGIIIFITGLFSGEPMHDVYRNYLTDSAFSLLANLVMLALLVVMAYTLHRKRKLSAQ